MATVYAKGVLHLPGNAHGFQPGEKIELPEALAKQLLADGLVTSSPPLPQGEGAERSEAGEG